MAADEWVRGNDAGVAKPSSRVRRLKPGIVVALAAGGLLLLGFLLRMVDLTDPPLDFHADRQLRSAVIARGMYYQMDPRADPATRNLALALKAATPTYEPEIFERMVSLIYLAIGREVLWMARVLGSLFWVVGGVFLYLLGRRLASDIGALIGLAYYLFLPFGVTASRSFQPDPFMVMWLLAACLALLRFADQPTWTRAAIFGLAAGLAILVKPMAAFPVGLTAAAMCLVAWGRRAVREPRLWLAAALALALPAGYYLLQTGAQQAGMFEYFVAAPAGLLTRPSFYIGWARLLNGMFGLTFLTLCLIGPLLLPRRARALLAGLWAGYLVYGLVFAYTIHTHDYYSLMLVPIVALSLAAVASVLEGRIRLQSQAVRLVALILVGLCFVPLAWNAIDNLRESDYRGEPVGWARLGEALPKDGGIIALTQEYGNRLLYYGWTQASMWPYQADLRFAELRGDADDRPFEQIFSDRTAGARYFLVTHFGELEQQADLKAHLENDFPIATQGDGFVVYDLGRGK